MIQVSTKPKRLAAAVDRGMKKLDGRRRMTKKLLQEYAGAYYRGPDTSNPRPLNLIHSAVNVLVPALVSRNPTFRVRARQFPHRGHAMMSEEALNHLVREIDYDTTLRQLVIDTLFAGVGISRTDIGPSGFMTTILDQQFDLGQPFVDRVSIDDFVLDPMARHVGEAGFIGHRYRVPKSYLYESGLYKTDPFDNNTDLWQDRDGDGKEAESAEAIWGGRRNEDENDLLEFVPLFDLYLPYEELVVTIPGSRALLQSADPESLFMRVIEYSGPQSEAGPYDLMGFHWLPDNPLPVSPTSIWYDMHVSANMVMRRVSRQANRQKTVLAYTPDAASDAQSVVDAEDGQSVRVNDVNNLKEVNLGGAPDESYEFLAWTKDQFSQQAGNVEQAGGLKSGVNTATQAEILQTNASARMTDMQHHVYGMAKRHARKLLHLIETDPFISIPFVKKFGGEEIPLSYTPEVREGDYNDFHLSIEPYSMQTIPPELKAKKKADWAANIYLPLVGAAMQGMQMGMPLNVNPVLKTTGRDFGIEEIDEMLLDMEGMQMQMMIAQAYAPQTAMPGAGPNMMNDPKNPSGRQPGIPGGAGMKGSNNTGKGSDTMPRGGPNGAGAQFQGG